jgi:hypothetical protein
VTGGPGVPVVFLVQYTLPNLRYRYLVVGTILVPNIVPVVRWISRTQVIENWLAWFIRKLKAFAEWIYIRSKVGNLVCRN